MEIGFLILWVPDVYTRKGTLCVPFYNFVSFNPINCLTKAAPLYWWFPI